jgi:hypothetical protein
MKPMILAFSLSIPFACASAQAAVGGFADRPPDPAQLPFGVPSGGCPIFLDGFDDVGVGQPFEYTSIGGYTVKIDRHTITITDAIGRNTVQHWGDPHENLNGKHLKDWGGQPEWDGSRRSMLLGDGTKVTMEAYGPQGVALSTSIYDGAQNLQFDNCRNALTHHGHDAVDTELRDAYQHDGETAAFATDAQTGVATYDNQYDENAQWEIVEFDVPLGTTGGYANPNQVNDLYDDPRLGHT